jgi:hypothetical protein
VYDTLLKLKIGPFDCAGFVQDDMISTFAFFYPIIISMSYLFTMLATMGHIVQERATKMKVI